MHSIVPAPLPVALQEKLTAQLLLDRLPRSHAAPLGQNPSQNGLAVVKMCGLQPCTFISRDREDLGGYDLADAHDIQEGRNYGYADTMDHTTSDAVSQRHYQSLHSCG